MLLSPVERVDDVSAWDARAPAETRYWRRDLRVYIFDVPKERWCQTPGAAVLFTSRSRAFGDHTLASRLSEHSA
jgi:hypothetical protein